MGFEELWEIVHKPSARELKTDLLSWAETIVNCTTGEGKLEFAPDELDLYRKYCAKYIGLQERGKLGVNHRDAKALEAATEDISRELELERQKEENRNPEHRARELYIQRAANLVSSVFTGERDGDNLFERLQSAVQTLTKSRTE